MRQPNGIVVESFFFKDAVGLFKLWRIAPVHAIKTLQFVVVNKHSLLLFDFRVGILDCFIGLFDCSEEFFFFVMLLFEGQIGSRPDFIFSVRDAMP